MSKTTEHSAPTDSQHGNGKLVPVGESIKYRRRAQQAERRAQDLEQKLQDLQAQLDARNEDLAQAEAQRDEAASRLVHTENRMAAERMLSQSGVVDAETASLLLAKRIDFSEQLTPEDLTGHVEHLLLDKPFLRSAAEAPLPPKTASAKPPASGGPGQLADAAERAIQSGDRRDVAAYLRLRRHANIH